MPAGAEEGCARNPEYAAGYRIQQRGAQQPPPEPIRLPASLSRLPWDLTKDEFGQKSADLIAVTGALMMRSAKDQFRTYLIARSVPLCCFASPSMLVDGNYKPLD